MSKDSYKDIRKPWFRAVKAVMRIFKPKTEFIYLGGKIDKPTIILSNHVGTSAPLAWELYGNLPFRFWGAHEMNSGLRALYKYQTNIYYHEKKHWNIHLARLFCLIASPLTCMFYKGINLISTYRDARFRSTVSESIDTLKDGMSVIIFPEISDKGYLDVLEGFHQGFTMLGRVLLKKGVDVQIATAYYKKDENKYIVDRPVLLSDVFVEGATRQDIAKKLCDRCNELGQMNLDAVGTTDETIEEKVAKII